MPKEVYILYIEDDRPMINLVKRTLNLSGYTVTGATSGKQGLSLIKERKPDLLLLDLMMSDTNGWDIYREMKSNAALADVPVIVITAKAPEYGKRVIEDLPPVDAYITKPFDVEHLIKSVQAYI
ncbi:MAG: response regulator [Chloroflexota bacterium]